jgi:PA domain-containing protein/thrombospondin type 3 repeat protein
MRPMTPKALLAPAALAALIFALAPVTPAFANANIVIVNANAAGVGFNDPTPAAPVGGNAGTTLGQQRLIAFQAAANIWGATLDSNVTIQIVSSFEPLACTATTATLGSAGTRFIFANFGSIPPFPGPQYPNTWYSQAEGNKRAGGQLNPAATCLNNGAACVSDANCPGSICTNGDIRARFNVSLGNSGCLTGIPWYLGLDDAHGTAIDLVTVLLHEFGHGLGFQQFGNLSTGAQVSGLTDVYQRNLLDTTTGKTWDQMTNAERVTSSLNLRHVVWQGSQVTSEVPSVLSFGTPNLRIDSPGSIAGNYAVGGASFGGLLTAAGVTGSIVQALDTANAAGPSTTDGCTTITNPAAIAGNIALIDRGTCGFIVKAKNAQNAGATAVIIANNAAGAPPPGLGGTDPTITIPTVSITLADANTIKAQLGTGVSGALLLDMTLRAGADGTGRAMMFAPNPVQLGSSISHWETIAFPNQLMEPAINDDLTHQVTGVDLTLAVMRDIGWFADADIDGIADASDNCPNDANADQADNDGDHLGDVCDPDDDNDGVLDGADNCPFIANADQANNDGDAQGDVCDPDDDNDGVLDGADNCPFAANADQLDTDGDGQGDACDADDDNDGVLDGADNCPLTANADQLDFDLDGIGDACDTATGPAKFKYQCMDGNFHRFDTPHKFPNQGQCVCYVMTGDVNGKGCASIKLED